MTSLANELRKAARDCRRNTSPYFDERLAHCGVELLTAERAADELERLEARVRELEVEVNRLSSELIKAGLKGLLKTGKVGSR